MKRLKTFGIYLLMVVGFYLLSNILIFVGLNTNYDKITSKETLPEQIEIYKAEATSVNGRIKGKIKNIDEVKDKYLKVELISDVETNMGTKYYDISEIKKENSDGEFKIYFKANYVEKYNISISDEKDDAQENSLDTFINEDMKKTAMLGLLISLFFI